MDNEKVLSSVIDGVGILTINIPKKKNALAADTVGEIIRLLKSWKDDEDVKVIVIKGAEGDFSSGGDLGSGGSSADYDEVVETVMNYGRIVKLIKQMPQAVIASVDGVAAGAGAAIALGCDYRIVSDSARMIFAFSKVALSGDTACMFMLDQLVGPAKALEFMMTGSSLTADQMDKLNMVNKVVAQDELDEATMDFARQLANGPRLAYQKQKELLYSLKYEGVLDDYLKKEASLMFDCINSEDVKIAVQAFMSKSKPVFVGK